MPDKPATGSPDAGAPDFDEVFGTEPIVDDPETPTPDDADPPEPEGDEPEGAEPEGGEPEGDEPEGDDAPPQPGILTADQLKELIEATRAANAPAQPSEGQEPQKPLTEEERNKLLNVWQPNEQDVSDLLEGGEAALSAASRMRDGIANQAFRMAQIFAQTQLQQFRSEVEPYINMARQAQVQQQTEQFYSKHPELRGHEQLVNTVFENIRGSGKKFDSIDQVNEALASSVHTILKQAGVEITKQPNKTPSQSKQTTTTKPKITPQPRGGQRGSSSGGNQQTRQDLAPGAELFGPR